MRFPRERLFRWQPEGSEPFQVNGRYETCRRLIDGKDNALHIWRRVSAVAEDVEIEVKQRDMEHKRVIRKEVDLDNGSPQKFRFEIFPRELEEKNCWLVTVVLRNTSRSNSENWDEREAVLYQSYFEVALDKGEFLPYPESGSNYRNPDEDELVLSLLYSKEANWGIGHGCSAAWESSLGETPKVIFADVMPAVELPSMTPNIEIDGKPVVLSMRDLAKLSDESDEGSWLVLENLVSGYEEWIRCQENALNEVHGSLKHVAQKNLEGCERCCSRIRAGIELLKENPDAREAFKLANLAMLLQQIAQKQVDHRPLGWEKRSRRVDVSGSYVSPVDIYSREDAGAKVGYWRAFQLAFLLMSLRGLVDGNHDDREVVDLIWFPTGGGKTEAYLSAMAFYMFYERLSASNPEEVRYRSGTNVLMRYTLRMLTTQQFQRAASLICAMEYIRRHPGGFDVSAIQGGRFSLGLWIGGDGSPNNAAEAKRQITRYKKGKREGNPLILTECPWCRSEIGRYAGSKPSDIRNNKGVVNPKRVMSPVSHDFIVRTQLVSLVEKCQRHGYPLR